MLGTHVYVITSFVLLPHAWQAQSNKQYFDNFNKPNFEGENIVQNTEYDSNLFWSYFSEKVRKTLINAQYATVYYVE